LPAVSQPGVVAVPLLWRAAIFALVLAVEVLAVSLRFDAATVFHSIGPARSETIAAFSVWAIHFLIGFAAIYATFLYLRSQVVLTALAGMAESLSFQPIFAALHFAALAVLVGCSVALSGSGASLAMLWLWLLAGTATLVFAAIALLPLPLWSYLLRATGVVGLWAAGGAVAAASAVALSWKLWTPLSGFTFNLVRWLLIPILPAMVVQPENLRLGSTKFTAMIAPACSGLEGAALLLVFLSIWLVLFRHEVRFPQALLLVPAGVALLLFLNAVRIAVLILIGHAGWRDVAAQGFHSQAGWIAFNIVAFGISVGARRIPWISRGTVVRSTAVRGSAVKSQEDAVSAYLLPFLAILLAAMLSRAASGKFEWLYGIRLLAVAVPLWAYRRTYLELAWRWEWQAVAAGFGVFAFWVGIDQVVGVQGSRVPMPDALMHAGGSVRTGWIAIRALTTVAVVPFAEELAFRGYLMRRFVDSRFLAVPPRAVGWLPMLGSSVLFGVLHGSRWVAGTLAGLCYAALYKRSGSVTSAVVAHAVTNLLLSIYVLVFSDWNYW
jgi:exosortase E/protease (VPEID-CTERM system)